MENSYSVTPHAISSYVEKVLRDRTNMPKSEIARRIINSAKRADRSHKGKPFYPFHSSNGGDNSFYLVSDPTNPFVIIDLVTIKEARERYGIDTR